MVNKVRKISIFSWKIIGPALGDAFKKLNPTLLIKNPVMFCVAVVAAVTTLVTVHNLVENQLTPALINGQITAWLWFTVLFGNFAEAMAEGKGKAQAASLRKVKDCMIVKVLDNVNSTIYQIISPENLKPGMIILVENGDIIPADGDVIQGIAYIDESAITGESEPVIRESGGDKSAVTAGTKIISDSIKIQITSEMGNSFLDRMIQLIDGAKRKKAPNEIALHIILSAFTLIFIVATVTILAFAKYNNMNISPALLIALFVTLIPTTIAGLLSAIGISGMDKLLSFNVLAKSGRAIEAAGDINTLLLDKTGTITLGNRHAVDFIPASGVNQQTLIDAAVLSSLKDETPEGRSVIELAKKNYKIDNPVIDYVNFEFVPFSAYTRLSGLNIKDQKYRKGAVESIRKFVANLGGEIPVEIDLVAESIAKKGGTPLAVCVNNEILGIIHLKDIVKQGIRKRFAEIRKMGIRTVMITGDNPLTAAAIAAEAGVDDFLSEATPEKKLDLIHKEQAKGKMVAMCGDGTNDAPALAQADVGLAMATGTSAAREAGNMIDLDSDPTKLAEIIKVGKQMLMTRGSLTTFSITNDVAKYFAIIPALFVTGYPQLAALNIMHLHSPSSAVLSAVIFNAIIIILLIPMALKGVRYKVACAIHVLRRNLAVYCVTGFIVPFIGIKLIDIIINALHIV